MEKKKKKKIYWGIRRLPTLPLRSRAPRAGRAASFVMARSVALAALAALLLAAGAGRAAADAFVLDTTLDPVTGASRARKTRRFGRRMPRVGFTFRPPDARYVSTPLHSSALKRACGTQCAAAARGRHPALRHLSGPQDLSLEPSSPVLGL